jgi:uncharacterized protein YukE
MVDVTDSKISVPPDLDQAAPTIKGIAASIGEEIGTLINMLPEIASAWVGVASDGHQVTQAQWNADATAMMSDVGTLGAIASALSVNSYN